MLQERSKALGYIESNVGTAGLKPLNDIEAQRAPDNVNQLQVTIIQCKDVMSRRKGTTAGKHWQTLSSLAAAAAAALLNCHLTEFSSLERTVL